MHLVASSTTAATALGLICLCKPAALADDIAEMSHAYQRAMQFEAKGDFSAAIPQHELSLRFARRAFGSQSKQAGIAMHNLAAALAATYQYGQAEEWYKRVIAVTEARLGKQHQEVAFALVHLGDLYHATGQYADAEPLYVRAMQIENAIADNQLEAAKTASKLGTLYVRTSQFTKAERFLTNALQVFQNTPSADSLDYAHLCNDAAGLYQALGQYAKAERLYQQALKTRESRLGSDDPEVAHSLHNLAWLYSHMRLFAKAEPMFVRSLQIIEKKYGANHADLQIILNNLANLQRVGGRLAEAEKTYQRGLRIAEVSRGADHPDVAFYLNNLGELAVSKGDYEPARLHYERSLKILRSRLGADHALLATVHHNMALLHSRLGDNQSASQQWDQSRRLVRRHAVRVLPLLSEKEQLDFLLNTDREHLTDALSFGVERRNDPMVAAVSAAWLANSKAATESAMAERTQLGRDPKLKKLGQRLQSVRAQMASLALAVQASQPGTQQTLLTSLTNEEEELSKQIARSRGEAEPGNEWVDIDAIRRSLASEEVLLDIIRLEPTTSSSKTGKSKDAIARYVAWLVPPEGNGSVHVVDLGPAADIESAIQAYQAEMRLAQTSEPAQNVLLELGEATAEQRLIERLRELSQRLLSPLAGHLQSAERIVVCPDAALWLIPWASLPVPDATSQYAIERWSIRYVVAARNVVQTVQFPTPAMPRPPRLFANPDYDLAPQIALSEYNAVFTQLGGTPIKPGNQSIAVDHLARRSTTRLGRVSRLPGTAAEAAAIAPKLQSFTHAAPRAYLDKQAQEGIFKRLASPQVLLISTHGFFLPDQAATAQKELAVPHDAGPRDAVTPLENPLLRCGLLLAGCNQAEQMTALGLDDGVLTGIEIVGCDLRHTELVVLSACETGLGRINQGEGVTGLRQAFQLSGAKAVVATLWQIPDLASAELMSDFFYRAGCRKDGAGGSAPRPTETHCGSARTPRSGTSLFLGSVDLHRRLRPPGKFLHGRPSPQTVPEPFPSRPRPVAGNFLYSWCPSGDCRIE